MYIHFHNTHGKTYTYLRLKLGLQRENFKKTPQPAPKKTEQFVLKKYSINTNSPPRSETPQSFPGNKFLSKNVLEVLEVLHQEGNGKLCVPNQKGPSKTRRQPFSGLLPRKFIICLGVCLFSKFPKVFWVVRSYWVLVCLFWGLSSSTFKGVPNGS